MKTYAKAILTTIVSFVGAITVALGTGNSGDIGSLSTRDWVVVAATTLGSGGLVWWTQNGPWHTYIKTVMAFLSAGVASLTVALNDNHITQAEWLVAFTAAVLATGLVFQAPGPTPPPTP